MSGRNKGEGWQNDFTFEAPRLNGDLHCRSPARHDDAVLDRKSFAESIFQPDRQFAVIGELATVSDMIDKAVKLRSRSGIWFADVKWLASHFRATEYCKILKL